MKIYIFLTIFFVLIAFTGCSSDTAFEIKESNQNQFQEKAKHPEKNKSQGYLGMSLPADFRAFSKSSPWNQSISDNAIVDSGSELMVRHLAKVEEQLKGAFTSWTVPIHVIDATKVKKVDVKNLSNNTNIVNDPDRNGIIENVPIPDDAWADPKEDAQMTLVDPKLRKSWDFKRVKRFPDGSWGGVGIILWDLDSQGYLKPFHGQYWWTYGAMASGMPLIVGIIRPEEIEAGVIKHALLCATPINRFSYAENGRPQVCSPPAARTDGPGFGFEYIPEGARIQLDPSLDLNAIGLSEATKVVAKAMQDYGMFNGMNADDFKIFFQNLGPDGGKWKKYNFFKDLSQIPIERFRILECELYTRP